MGFRYGGYSKVGFRRENNEDFLMVKELGDKLLLAIIADGAGSEPSKLQPAQLACRKISEMISRVYNDGAKGEGNAAIRQLTKDQTEAQLLVDEGKIAEEQYYFHEARNKLLCPLGSFETPKLDRFSGKIRKDCIFLMTTDGIHYAIRPEPMTSLVLENPNFDDACVTLCEAAESLESNDDYGAILIQCV